jgi:hypothetical protein
VHARAPMTGRRPKPLTIPAVRVTSMNGEVRSTRYVVLGSQSSHSYNLDTKPRWWLAVRDFVARITVGAVGMVMPPRPPLPSSTPPGPLAAYAPAAIITSLREKLINIGQEIVGHSRYVTFQLAEVAVSRQMFKDILMLIARLRAPPAPA